MKTYTLFYGSRSVKIQGRSLVNAMLTNDIADGRPTSIKEGRRKYSAKQINAAFTAYCRQFGGVSDVSR